MSTSNDLGIDSWARSAEGASRPGELTLRRERVRCLRVKAGIKTGFKIAPKVDVPLDSLGCPTHGTGCDTSWL